MRRIAGWMWVALWGLTAAGTTLPGDAAEWRVGLGRVVITPSEPVWLSGYSHRDHAAEGKIHDLYAKAACFTDEQGTTFVLVTCDLGSMYAELRDAVASAAASRFGIPADHVLINISHTHCAPEIAKERPVFHDLPAAEEAKLAKYIAEELQPKLIDVIGQAVADRQPAVLTLSQSTAEFAKNRRFPTDNGYVNQPYEAGVTDHDVPVLQVRSLEGVLRGLFFGYACHNTTLAFYQYCGDYAGFAQEYVEAAHPGITAGFVMGCGGDQNPYPRHGELGLEHCRKHGRELADAVLRATAGPQTVVHGPLAVARTSVTLDLEPLPSQAELERQATTTQGIPQRKARYLLGLLDQPAGIPTTQACPLLAARFGRELLFVGISGETVVDYSRRSKVDFRGPTVWVAGYNDDVFAYLPSQRVLLEGGYEGRTGIIHQLTATPFLPSVEARVMAGLKAVVDQVTTGNGP